MIELYSGTPGSGKSLHVAKVIASRLRSFDRFVIGNFSINRDAVKCSKGFYIYCCNDRLDPFRLVRFSVSLSRHLGRRLKEGEILLVIDEAQLIFNPRDWQKTRSSGWLSFFTQHRHYGFDVILIAQHDRMIDRQVRCLFEYEVVHRKVRNAGSFGLILSLLFGGHLFVAINRWYPIKEKIDSSFFVGTSKYFSFYDSYNHFDTPGAGIELGR